MISLLVPVACAGCGGEGAVLCGECASGLAPAPEVGSIPGLDCCSALFAYEGLGREVVASIKFRRRRSAVGLLAEAMAALVAPLPGEASAREPSVPFGAVTWAPTSRRHRRERGFDQAELLARAVARSLGVPAARMLRHAGGGGLTGRSRAERQGSVRFEPRQEQHVGRLHGPPSVLLVDDVVTTGATLSAAATALRRGGAAEVHALCLAATP